VRRTDVVQDLERRLHGMEQQRDALNRQLEDVIARSGRMEQAFSDLERRFRSLDAERPPAPPVAAPSEPAP
jgi:phage shock protein A